MSHGHSIPCAISAIRACHYCDRDQRSLRRRALHDCLDHRRAYLRRFLKPRLKEPRRLRKPLLVQLEAPKRDALAPPPRRHDELEVVPPVRHIIQRGVERSVQSDLRPEEVLCYSNPEPKDRRGG